MFNRLDLARVASASTGSQANWLYRTDDNLTDVLDPNYFGLSAPQFRVNDVIQCKLIDRYVNLAVLTVDSPNNQVSTQQIDFVTPLDQQGLVNWRGNWAQEPYEKNDQVLDNGWLMIANKTTEDRPAPQPTGTPFYVYDGTLITDAVVAKQVITGTRYEFLQGGYLKGYRIKTIIGNEYSVYLVNDPLGVQQINELITFTGDVNAWVDFGIASKIVSTGVVLDLVVIIQEPAQTPVIKAINYNYLTPNNFDAPLNGQIVQANQNTSLLRISNIDNDAIDQSVFLSGLEVGDIIDNGVFKWSIQSINPQVGFYDFSVSPTAQHTPDGVQVFNFETVDPTPISYGIEEDYWLTKPNIQGLFIADGSYFDIVPDDNAYIADLLIQDAYVSPDWDLLSFSEGSTTSSFNTLTEQVITGASFNIQEPTVLDVPIQLEFGPAQSGQEIEVDALGNFTVIVEDEYILSLRLQMGREGNPGISVVFGRALINGVQLGNSVFAQLEDSNESIPTTFRAALALKAGDIFTVEIYRDSIGTNFGGVYSKISTLPGWNDAPSCQLIITRTTLV